MTQEAQEPRNERIRTKVVTESSGAYLVLETPEQIDRIIWGFNKNNRDNHGDGAKRFICLTFCPLEPHIENGVLMALVKQKQQTVRIRPASIESLLEVQFAGDEIPVISQDDPLPQSMSQEQ